MPFLHTIKSRTRHTSLTQLHILLLRFITSESQTKIHNPISLSSSSFSFSPLSKIDLLHFPFIQVTKQPNDFNITKSKSLFASSTNFHHKTKRHVTPVISHLLKSSSSRSYHHPSNPTSCYTYVSSSFFPHIVILSTRSFFLFCIIIITVIIN